MVETRSMSKLKTLRKRGITSTNKRITTTPIHYYSTRATSRCIAKNTKRAETQYVSTEVGSRNVTKNRKLTKTQYSFIEVESHSITQNRKRAKTQYSSTEVESHSIAQNRKRVKTQYSSAEVESHKTITQEVESHSITQNSKRAKTQYGCIEVGFSSITKDRLSELPDEVLVHILSFLPIKCAVRTLLLRRFGNLWTLLPTLEFSFCSLKFVRNVMKKHKSPAIDRWAFKGKWTKNTEEKVSSWVYVALKKQPKVFEIAFEYGFCGDMELHRTFISQSIVTLNLSNIVLNLPHQVNMGSLRRLELFDVEMIDEDLKLLELGCPCLQALSVSCPHGLKKLHFTAANIESLELKFTDGDRQHYSLDCPNVKFLHIERVDLDNVKVIDVSSVSHARINDYSPNTDHHFEKLLKKFRNAKVFHLRDEHGHCHSSGDKVCMQVEQCGNGNLNFRQNGCSHLALKSGFPGSCLLNICRLLKLSVFERTYIACLYGFVL